MLHHIIQITVRIRFGKCFFKSHYFYVNTSVSLYAHRRAGKDEVGEDFEKYFFGNKNRRNVNHKREANNKKHGFLGKPARLKKRNDATSASDTRDYRQPRKGGGARKGSRSGSGGNRMGKNARAAKRQKRS